MYLQRGGGNRASRGWKPPAGDALIGGVQEADGGSMTGVILDSGWTNGDATRAPLLVNKERKAAVVVMEWSMP